MKKQFWFSLRPLRLRTLRVSSPEDGGLRNFSWLITGVLAGMGRPRTADALLALRDRGVRVVVSLTEKTPPAAWLGAAGLNAIHLPVRDFTAPTPAQIQAAVAAIDRARATHMPVVVHCAGGRGRTGTVLACYLVSWGMDAADAVAAVRADRPGSIETAAQEAAVAAYGAALRRGGEA